MSINSPWGLSAKIYSLAVLRCCSAEVGKRLEVGGKGKVEVKVEAENRE